MCSNITNTVRRWRPARRLAARRLCRSSPTDGGLEHASPATSPALSTTYMARARVADMPSVALHRPRRNLVQDDACPHVSRTWTRLIHQDNGRLRQCSMDGVRRWSPAQAETKRTLRGSPGSTPMTAPGLFSGFFAIGCARGEAPGLLLQNDGFTAFRQLALNFLHNNVVMNTHGPWWHQQQLSAMISAAGLRRGIGQRPGTRRWCLPVNWHPVVASACEWNDPMRRGAGLHGPKPRWDGPGRGARSSDMMGGGPGIGGGGVKGLWWMPPSGWRPHTGAMGGRPGARAGAVAVGLRATSLGAAWQGRA